MASHPSFSEVKKVVFLLPLWQLVLGVVVALVFLLFSGKISAFAAFYGASVGFVGSLVFAFFLFGFGDQDPKNITRKMFRAEGLKILAVAAMFYFASAVLVLPIMPVIIGFMATYIMFFVALLTVFR